MLHSRKISTNLFQSTAILFQQSSIFLILEVAAGEFRLTPLPTFTQRFPGCLECFSQGLKSRQSRPVVARLNGLQVSGIQADGFRKILLG